ncbi:MAG TPA: hypothetical protein VF747_16865, partial [Blastocatellia bacterium]
IIKWENRVVVRRGRGGQTEEIVVVQRTPFYSGDTLIVGADSSATVYCINQLMTCSLSTGTYPNCCIPVCAKAIQLQPRIGEKARGRPRRTRRELPQGEQTEISEAENAIGQMRLGGVLENLLYATLYSSYNIDEAAPSLNKLIESLSSQQGADELGQLYVPTMRNAGYLTYALGYEEVAGALYVKAVLASLKTSDTRAQAASYFDLANFYKVTGKTDKATESFVKAYELYKLSGDKEKMSDIDRQPIFKDALKDRPNKDSLTRQPGTSRRP